MGEWVYVIYKHYAIFYKDLSIWRFLFLRGGPETYVPPLLRYQGMINRLSWIFQMDLFTGENAQVQQIYEHASYERRSLVQWQEW